MLKNNFARRTVCLWVVLLITAGDYCHDPAGAADAFFVIPLLTKKNHFAACSSRTRPTSTGTGTASSDENDLNSCGVPPPLPSCFPLRMKKVMTMGLISAACAAFFAATTAMLPLPCHAAAITTTTSTATTTSITTTTTTYGNDVQEWQLMNGQVRLPSSLQLTIIKNNHQNDGKGATSTATTTFLTLKNPTLIGAGGGGSVFAFDNHNKDQLPATASDSTSPKLSDILIKVSWKGSTETVQKECQTLQLLEEYHIEGVERCRGEVPYLYNAQDGDNRVMIVVEPYVPDAVASVIEVPNHDNNNNKRVYVVQQIARTLIQMLAHNIVTIDVQPLISQTTGQVIFIDMTEAQRLQTPFTFLDTAVMGSFITEMLALIPEELAPVAAQTMREELQSLRDNQGIELSTQAKEILMDQSLFFPEQDI